MARQISRTTARRHPFGASDGPGRQHIALGDEENVGRVRLGDEARASSMRASSAGGVGLNLREDRRNQVIVMNFRVEAVRRGAAARHS